MPLTPQEKESCRIFDKMQILLSRSNTELLETKYQLRYGRKFDEEPKHDFTILSNEEGSGPPDVPLPR